MKTCPIEAIIDATAAAGPAGYSSIPAVQMPTPQPAASHPSLKSGGARRLYMLPARVQFGWHRTARMR
jgi:hypothetical protein